LRQTVSNVAIMPLRAATASTKISSRLRPEARARSPGVPASATRPAHDHELVDERVDLLHYVARSSTQRPWARSSRSQSRRCRVAMTSKPLVGSSSRRCCGFVDERCGERDLRALPREKPFARRSAIARDQALEQVFGPALELAGGGRAGARSRQCLAAVSF